MARLCYRLYFNRNRFEREYVEYLRHATELAAARQIDRLKEIENPDRSWTIKNLIGIFFEDMAKPAFAKVVTVFWQAEDQRLALLAQLQKS
jgi:hypothetical protein